MPKPNYEYQKRQKELEKKRKKEEKRQRKLGEGGAAPTPQGETAAESGVKPPAE